jgi:hypothetical protein
VEVIVEIMLTLLAQNKHLLRYFTSKFQVLLFIMWPTECDLQYYISGSSVEFNYFGFERSKRPE